MLKSLHSLKNGYIFVPTNKLKHKTMTKKELLKGLTNLKNNDLTICIEKDWIELRFYIDKRDNAICVTNDAYSGTPCDCYENTEKSIERLTIDTLLTYPEIYSI